MTSMASEVALLVNGQHELGEGVLWCDRTHRLFWTDIHAATLWCHDPAENLTSQWPMPERLACLALTEDVDCLLLGLASGLAWFRLSSAAVTPICKVEPELPGTRLNDGRCDRHGAFVFGTLNEAPDRAPIASFYRLAPDLSLKKLALPAVAISNSICFSPDGLTMYYCDTLNNAIDCCDYDPVQGVVSNPRQFVSLVDQPGGPDGSTVDAEGFLWNAQWGGSRVVRYAPGGTIERIIPIPVEQPSCVALGGTQFDVLYVTTAREDLSEAALASQPAAGGLFHVRVAGVRGLPEGRFAGKPAAMRG